MLVIDNIAPFFNCLCNLGWHVPTRNIGRGHKKQQAASDPGYDCFSLAFSSCMSFAVSGGERICLDDPIGRVDCNLLYLTRQNL